MGAVNSTEAQHAVATQNNMSIEAVLAAPPNASTVVSPLCLKYAHHLAAKSDVAPIQGVGAFSIVAFSLFAADSFYWFFKNKPWRLSSMIDVLITIAGPILICGGEIALLWLFHETYAYHFYCEAMPDWSSYGRETGFWITMIVFATPVMWVLLWVGAMALVLGFWALCKSLLKSHYETALTD